MRLYPTTTLGATLNTMGLDVAIPHSAIQTPQTAIRTTLFSWGRIDLRNICLVLAAFAVVLLLIPPGRSYPMSDDWAYAQSVERLLNLNYYPHDAIQPSSLGHLILGVVASLLFGFNFTTLSLATLVVSACCLLAFYAFLRQLGVAPTPALLGTALLGLNPMYVYLSYSFMTDITFMLYMLVACLCFTRWAQGSPDRWLLFGSIATALAYLTRQHGIVLVPAMLFFLWYSRRLQWRNVLIVCLIPLLTLVAFMIWERTQPVQLVSFVVSTTTQRIFSDPLTFAGTQLMRTALVLIVPGICLLPLAAFFLPRRLIFAVLIGFTYVFILIRALGAYGTVLPVIGSLVDHTGFILYTYDADPIWSEEIWTVLAVIGAVTMSLYLTTTATSLFQWLREVRNPQSQLRATPDPAIIAYATGLLLAAITFASPFLFDRYVLPLIPIMLLFPLRRMSAAHQAQTTVNTPADKLQVLTLRAGIAFILLIPIALFSLLALRDYRDHAATRWQAAEQLAKKGIPREQVSAGFEWSSWYLYEKGVNYIRTTGDMTYSYSGYLAVLDPVYTVGDLPLDGYKEISSLNYQCWLCGNTTRRVLVQERLP